jgi:hypothetical protein
VREGLVVLKAFSTDAQEARNAPLYAVAICTERHDGSRGRSQNSPPITLIAGSCHQDGDSGAEMRLRRVEELGHERVPLERVLHDAALDALAAAVNQPHFHEPCGVCRGHVLVDHRRDVTRLERVEIQCRLYRNPMRLTHGFV